MNGVLDDKIVRVTGGTGGIGTATCKRRSDMGARAVSTCIAADKAGIHGFIRALIGSLACDDAAFMAGANLAANGGQ